MKILVLTGADDCCGPMAAHFMNDFNGSVEACSAGVCPAEKVKSQVIELMHECFCDLSDYKPTQFELSMLEEADLIVIIGEISLDVPSDKCMRLEMLPQLIKVETETKEEFRTLCDYVKNESFVMLKSAIGRYSKPSS